jgi:hypothetical protein
MLAVRDIPILPGFPPVDFARAERVCLEGIPLAASHYCSMDALYSRNFYDNHQPLTNVLDQVRAKFTKEEENSFHLALPRFLFRFIPGLHLSPLTWVERAQKGRICVDATNLLHPTNNGAPNSAILPPLDSRAGKTNVLPFFTPPLFAAILLGSGTYASLTPRQTSSSTRTISKPLFIACSTIPI